MKEGSLVIDGKKYISSARAAQLVGYTKDYVGQLARAGKIDSKLIGRSWYVAEDSITKHKLTVHYTLTKPKKTRINAHHQESLVGKIINKNIDKSSIISAKFTPPSHAEIDITETDNIFEKDTRDLFPIPNRKSGNRDTALLHSDIYYERVDANSDMVTSDENRRFGAIGANDVRAYAYKAQDEEAQTPISIRTKYQNRDANKQNSAQTSGIFAGITRTSTHTLQKTMYNQRPTVDGIVVQSSAHRDVLRFHEDEYLSEEPALEEDSASDTQKPRARAGRRRSRAIPVFGALIIFCILALLYFMY